ncbi:MAG: DivIVA domain-containing protein, partial [Clostridia bacterium]|nr:DivIVA domain-containing protein [Clostridia bacterium]
MEFHVVKKGYAPSEVDEYVAAVKREYEATVI